jgi:hypothetical protein
MNATKPIIVTMVTDVKKLEALANLLDGTPIRYATGIQYETLRDAFEYAYPTKTLIPFRIGSEGYTTYGANSCFINYK